MSIGAPSTLGTLLIQRLDAVLGTTLSQQANLASGARPGAITQPGNPESPHSPQNTTQRHPREAVDKAGAHEQGRSAINRTAQAEAAALRAGRAATQSGATPSAPTTLGFAARTILALLAAYPDSVQLARGQAPLVAGQAGTPRGGTPATGTPLPATTPGSGSAAAAPQSTAGTHRPGMSAWGNLAAALGEPGALPAQFTQSLAQTLRTSGMFYESHLANLAFGKTSAPALQQEPQGQIKLGGTPPGTAPGQPAQAAQPGPSTIQASLDPGALSNQPTGTQGTGPAPGATAASGAAQPIIPGVDPQAQLLVRQQLEVLANQSFAWQGEAWPGASMRWEIGRREEDAANDGMPEHWATRLSLQLPALGEVRVRLTLTDKQLVMRLVAPASADRLSEHIEGLRGRLLAQGLQASQLSVLDHEPASPEPDTHEPTTQPS